MLRLTVQSCERMARQHDWFLAENERAVEKALGMGGLAALQRVNSNPPFKPQTGKLQKATKAKVARLGSGRVLRLTNSKHYASFVESGTKPHVIRAKRHMGAMLRFRGKGGGFVFARKVKHPGTKPYRFLQRGLLAARNEFTDEMDRSMSAIAARF
jgi:hypothetical protein